MYTLSPDTIKYADNTAVEKYGIPELSLMKNAANACFEYIKKRITHDSKITVICGKGNNGGDGYELSSLLKNGGYDVTVINAFDCEPVTDVSKTVYSECIQNGVSLLPFCEWEKAVDEANVIIDSLFGVGFYGCIQNDSSFGRLLTACNEKSALRIAVDTPSGINSADGKCEGVCFRADMTVTMAYIKTGMLSYPARDFCGEILIADIGYPEKLKNEIPKDALVPDEKYLKDTIPQRAPNTHKGSYGRLLMYCASPDMTGAGVLAALGALRSGAGLVNIARDEKTIRLLQTHLTEPVFSVLGDSPEEEILPLCKKASAVLIGCGMGQAEKERDVLCSLIKNADCNLIIDADGINLLSLNTNVLKEAKKTPVLTPHPLEFARLCGLSADDVQADRINLAKKFAKEYSCVLVLKGANTIITSPDGKLAINTSGNPGLSKGGSGDVLAGVISSFVCQGTDVFDSAVLGVHLHGRAADVLKEEISEYGLLPSDLPMAIAKLLP